MLFCCMLVTASVYINGSVFILFHNVDYMCVIISGKLISHGNQLIKYIPDCCEIRQPYRYLSPSALHPPMSYSARCYVR